MSTVPENSTNSRRGAEFELKAVEMLNTRFGWNLELNVPIAIGFNPSVQKTHKFDLVSTNKSSIGECMYITWTVSGNMPSAKMAFANQAVLYLHCLTESAKRKFIVMPRSIRAGKGESLAEYYYRTYRHLLGDIIVLELDEHTSDVNVLGEVEPL